MPLPCSGRKLNELGKRLADGAASDADRSLFAQVVDAYQAVLDLAERRLSELGFQATTRVKTTGTLVEKLQRDATLKLRSVHDLAGARIVIDGGRLEQDAATASIVHAFASCSKPPTVKDRREVPSHGYRAVHVIIFPEDIPVEIQIRTKPQDGWAQFAETLGDRWGRGLRYGQGPDEPAALAGPPFSPLLTRAQVVEKWIQFSDLIDCMERLSLEIGELGVMADSGASIAAGTVGAVQHRFTENMAAISSFLAELSTVSGRADSE